jgi:hypothetical protein
MFMTSYELNAGFREIFPDNPGQKTLIKTKVDA